MMSSRVQMDIHRQMERTEDKERKSDGMLEMLALLRCLGVRNDSCEGG